MQHSNNPTQPNISNAFNNATSPQQSNNNNTRNIFSRNVITNPLGNPTNNPNKPNIFSNKPITINQTPSNNNIAGNDQQNNALANSVQFTQKPQSSNPFNRQSTSNNNLNNNSNNVFSGPLQNNAFANINIANQQSTNLNIGNQLNNRNNIKPFGTNFQGVPQNQKPFVTNFSNTSPTISNGIFKQSNPHPQGSIRLQVNSQRNQFHNLANNTINSSIIVQNQQSNNLLLAQQDRIGKEHQVSNNMQCAAQMQLINMMKSINIHPSSFNTLISPFNYYHAKLILTNLITSIKQSQMESTSVNAQNDILKVKVKDSENQLLIMIKQMNTTAAQLKNTKLTMKQLQIHAQKIKTKIKKQLQVKRQKWIDKFKWQKMSKDILQQLSTMEDYLSNTMRPIFMAVQANKQIQLCEPDSFSLQIANILHKQISKIKAHIDQLVNEAGPFYQSISHSNNRNFLETNNIIHQLIIYLQALCFKFQQLKEYLDSKLQEQPKNTISQLKNKIGLIKQREICKVKSFMNAISKNLKQKINKNINGSEEIMKRQTF